MKTKLRKTSQMRMKKYIEYLANPNKKQTSIEFAKSLGYKGKDPDRQLQYFRNEKGFWDKVWDRFINHYLQGELPEVNTALIDKAKTGDTKAIEMIYKVAEKIKDKMDITSGGEPIEFIVKKLK